jgi:hypothetical protein
MLFHSIIHTKFIECKSNVLINRGSLLTNLLNFLCQQLFVPLSFVSVWERRTYAT